MRALALAVLLFASAATAQNRGSEGLLVLYLGPPALVTLAMDVVLLTTLIPDGTARRGHAITTTVFSFIGAALAVACLAMGASASPQSPEWMIVSGATLAYQLGSAAVGIFGLLHPEPPSEAPPVRPAPYVPPPPQLFMLPFTVKL